MIVNWNKVDAYSHNGQIKSESHRMLWHQTGSKMIANIDEIKSKKELLNATNLSTLKRWYTELDITLELTSSRNDCIGCC